MGNLFSAEEEKKSRDQENPEEGTEEPTKKDEELPKTPLMLFLEAAAEGNLQLLREMHMEDSSLLNTPDTGPLIPLGEEDDPKYKNIIRSRNTALHCAAEHGQTEAMSLLLNLMADVTAKDCIGSTPLHRAVSCGKTDCVRLLLDNNAKVDAMNLIGNTPVHVAAYVGHTEVMKILLAKGGRQLLDTANSVNMTPRMYATRAAMKELIGNPGDPWPEVIGVDGHAAPAGRGGHQSLDSDPALNPHHAHSAVTVIEQPQQQQQQGQQAEDEVKSPDMMVTNASPPPQQPSQPPQQLQPSTQPSPQAPQAPTAPAGPPPSSVLTQPSSQPQKPSSPIASPEPSQPTNNQNQPTPTLDPFAPAV